MRIDVLIVGDVSLRMSFWSVPLTWRREYPCFSTIAMNIAQITAAGELMVIEVEISPQWDPVNNDLHVGE